MEFSFNVVQAVDDESKDITQFILDHFFGKSPICIAFQIKDHPTLEECPSLFTQGSKNFVLKAVSSQDELIGVAIVQENPVSWRKTTSSEGENLMEFIKFCRKHIHTQPTPGRKTTTLFKLVVHESWAGRGVGRALTEECMKLARSAGFDAIEMSCSSEYTAKIAKSLGWKEYRRLTYEDYPRLSGAQVSLVPTAPHRHVYYFVKDL